MNFMWAKSICYSYENLQKINRRTYVVGGRNLRVRDVRKPRLQRVRDNLAVRLPALLRQTLQNKLKELKKKIAAATLVSRRGYTCLNLLFVFVRKIFGKAVEAFQILIGFFLVALGKIVFVAYLR